MQPAAASATDTATVVVIESRRQVRQYGDGDGKPDRRAALSVFVMSAEGLVDEACGVCQCRRLAFGAVFASRRRPTGWTVKASPPAYCAGRVGRTGPVGRRGSGCVAARFEGQFNLERESCHQTARSEGQFNLECRSCQIGTPTQPGTPTSRRLAAHMAYAPTTPHARPCSPRRDLPFESDLQMVDASAVKQVVRWSTR